MSEPFKVLEKGGMSYVELDWRRNDTRINGEKAIACPGNDKWAMVEGKITSLEYVRQVQGEVTGFRLADRYRNLVALPETQPLDAFERAVDCGGIAGELSEFYEVVRAEPTEETEVLEWQVINLDCEPMQMPDYVQAKFPDSLRQYPQTWHKYPCYITMPNVFSLVYDKVAEAVDGSDRKYERDNYKNIQVLEVWENVPVNFPLHRRVVRIATTKKGKDKVEEIPETVRKIPVFKLYGTYKTDREFRGTDVGMQIQAIHGESYGDLQKKLEEYVQSFLIILLDGAKREVCPHCKGTGIVEVKK